MNNLREIKKPRLLHDESFTYMLCSDERTNADDPVYLTNFYDLPFGGFREPYEEYKVEVLSFVCGGGIPLATGYYIFVVENLDADGYFCSKKLTNKEIVLSKLPLNAVSDAYYQSDGGTIGFKIKNARNVRNVRFSFLTSSFTIPDVDAINSGGETKWVLTLRMTPIVNY
jgi:hypothetical protein